MATCRIPSSRWERSEERASQRAAPGRTIRRKGVRPAPGAEACMAGGREQVRQEQARLVLPISLNKPSIRHIQSGNRHVQSLPAPNLVSLDLSHQVTSTLRAAEAQNCGVFLTLHQTIRGSFELHPKSDYCHPLNNPLPSPTMDLIQDTSISDPIL